MVIKMFESNVMSKILTVCLMVVFMIAGIYIGAKYIEKTEDGENNKVVDVVNETSVKVYNEEEEEQQEEPEKENIEVIEDITVTYVDIYSECGHRKEEQSVHMHGNKEQIVDNVENSGYGYELMGDEEGMLVFERVYKGNCEDHYKIALKDGKVVVYRTNENGEYELYQTLEIDATMIREDILKQLELGVNVDSTEELFLFLEDVES